MTLTVVLTPNSADAFYKGKFNAYNAFDQTYYSTPGGDYGNNKLSNRDVMRVGFNYDATYHEGDCYRSCLTFTRGSIPLNAIVTQARLRIYCVDLQLKDVNFKPEIQFYRILNSWQDHNVYWSQLSTSSSSSGSINIYNKNAWYEIDLTSDVNCFLSSGEWLGWMLKAKRETPYPLKNTIGRVCYAILAGREYNNPSLKPQLVVTYESEKTFLMPSLQKPVFHTPVFYIESLKSGYVKPSNIRVTLNYGSGVPSFRVWIPDNKGKLSRKFNLLDDVKIWVFDQGEFKLLMRGVIIKTSTIITEKGYFIELEGYNYSYYLMIREKNQVYENKEISEIVLDLASLTPEIEAKYYVIPTPKNIKTFSAYESIFGNLVDLAKIASLTGEEYGFWVCEGTHMFENRPNLHFQPINKDYNIMDLNLEDCWEISFTREAPKANKLNIRWSYYDLNKVKTVEAIEKEVLIEKTLWNYYIKDEEEAEAWGNAQLQTLMKPQFNIEAITPLNINFTPGKLVRFYNEDEVLLLKIIEVEHIYNESQALTKLNLKS
ncbi:MAG: DNRLRE domain-containing protein [Candidatus Bathyarchaeia archaeon]|nr:DNRLRE domain-containing protein [Candidatus Bathyarchaeota archaeon]